MRFDRLDLNLLVALDVLLAERNVSTAARRLRLSQSALSGALARLRDFFDDALLVPSGRQMVPTPKAEALAGPIRQMLDHVRAHITSPEAIDPGTAERCFRLSASDYAYDVLLAATLARAAILAPRVTFDIITPERDVNDRLERGEVDLILTLGAYLRDDHPRLALFDDEQAVICCQSNPACRDGLDEATFFALGHVVVQFGTQRLPAITESHFAREGLQRRIELRVPGFSALPRGVIGTSRLATLWRRQAELYAQLLPIRVLPPPIALPGGREEAQWHGRRDKDPGLRWLLALLKTEADRLSPLRPAPGALHTPKPDPGAPS